MDSALLDRICAQVYRQFPEVKGARPKVSAYPNQQSSLTFRAKASLPDGRSLSHTVRVIVDAAGKITKTTTSRS